MKIKHLAAAAIAGTFITIGGISQVQAAQVTPVSPSQNEWVCPNNQEGCTGQETCQGYGRCNGGNATSATNANYRTVNTSNTGRGGCCGR